MHGGLDTSTDYRLGTMNDWFEFVGEFSEWHVAHLRARRQAHAREHGSGGSGGRAQSSDLYGSKRPLADLSRSSDTCWRPKVRPDEASVLIGWSLSVYFGRR